MSLEGYNEGHRSGQIETLKILWAAPQQYKQSIQLQVAETQAAEVQRGFQTAEMPASWARVTAFINCQSCSSGL